MQQTFRSQRQLIVHDDGGDDGEKKKEKRNDCISISQTRVVKRDL